MWFVNQIDEYNPVHIHTNCKVSSVVYLKTPKKQIRDRKKHYSSDGRITFMNNSGTDFNFANSRAISHQLLVICIYLVRYNIIWFIRIQVNRPRGFKDKFVV